MSTLPARFHIVHCAREREESDAVGEVAFAPAFATLAFSADGYGFRIRIEGDVVTITREGADGYTVLLREGETSAFTVGDMQLPVVTEKLLFRRRGNRADFMAAYRLGGGQTTRMIVHAAF